MVIPIPIGAGGNLSWRISLGIQFRVFSVPGLWLKKRDRDRDKDKAAFLLLRSREGGREYYSSKSSGGPVRYIPRTRRCSNNDGFGFTHNSFPFPFPPNASQKQQQLLSRPSVVVVDGNGDGGGGTSSFQQKHRKRSAKERLLVFDGSPNQNELEPIIDSTSGHRQLMKLPKDAVRIMDIQQDNDGGFKTHGADTTTQPAEKVALELLATRAFTAVELRKKLQGKKFPSDIVESVITNFQNRGFINDSLYAETFSRSRWSSSSWGPRRIKQALFKKGVSEADADKAVKLVFKDGESGDQESKHGFSKHSMDHLLVQASKQWLRGQDVNRETRKARIIRWLQYRGFNWDVISCVLKELESQYPP